MEEKTNYSIKHLDDYSDFLTHFGVKGMRWRKGRKTPEQKPLTYADRIRQEYERKQALEKNKASGKNKTKKILNNKSLSKKKVSDYASGIIKGKYGNGMDRINALRKAGVSANDVIRIQTNVNKQMGVNSGPSKSFTNAVNSSYKTKKSSSKKRSSKKKSSKSNKGKAKLHRNKYGYLV